MIVVTPSEPVPALQQSVALSQATADSAYRPETLCTVPGVPPLIGNTPAEESSSPTATQELAEPQATPSRSRTLGTKFTELTAPPERLTMAASVKGKFVLIPSSPTATQFVVPGSQEMADSELTPGTSIGMPTTP